MPLGDCCFASADVLLVKKRQEVMTSKTINDMRNFMLSCP
jgi:hypothetical protein